VPYQILPPEVAEVWAVVPLSRPQMAARVRDNLERQVFPTRAVVVENGPGIGACRSIGFSPDVLLTSEQHQSHARNAALKWLREHRPEAYWVAMDDDDYYSPEYSAEHAGLAKRGRLVGKSTAWVLFEDWFLALFRPWNSSGSGTACNGATIGAFIADSPDFLVREVGEDGAFCGLFRQRGGKVWLSSPHHTAYCRRGDGRGEHTFKSVHSDFVRWMGSSGLAFPPDRLDLVEGKNSLEGGKPFDYHHLPDRPR
jgi:glycosyltransferase involved in cell wall biosynthesis